MEIVLSILAVLGVVAAMLALSAYERSQYGSDEFYDSNDPYGY